MRVMVLGSEGFVGQNLIPSLLANRHSVLGIDRARRQCEADRNYSFEQASITSSIAIRRHLDSWNPDVVINLAAESYVHNSNRLALRHLASNTRLPLLLCRALKDPAKKTPWLIHFSTCEVYGNCPERGADEETLPEPVTAYAATKLAGENIVAALARAGTVRATVLRPFNLFGPHQQSNRLIPATIGALLAHRPVPIHDGGDQVRDWLAITELLDVMNRLLLRGPVAGLETFNVSAGRPLAIHEVVRTVASVLGFDGPVSTPERLPQTQMRYSLGRSDRLREELAWTAAQSFEDLLAEYLDPNPESMR